MSRIMNTFSFRITEYCYNSAEKELEITGNRVSDSDAESEISVIVKNPGRKLLMEAMSAYDRRYANAAVDISLVGNVI